VARINLLDVISERSQNHSTTFLEWMITSLKDKTKRKVLKF